MFIQWAVPFIIKTTHSTRVAPHFNCSQISSHIETNRFCVKIYNTFEALCFCIYILQFACFELMVVCNTATITSAATNLIHTVLSYFRMLFCTACVTDTVLRSTRSSSLISSSGCWAAGRRQARGIRLASPPVSTESIKNLYVNNN